MNADSLSNWADLTRPRTLGPVAPAEEPTEDVAPNKCYATVWGSGRAAPMIEFRLPDGTTETFGYAWLRRVASDAARRLVLYFSPADRVILEGHDLGKLRGLLSLQRVVWVDSLDPLHAASEAGPVVTGITVELSDRHHG
jgi:hypothetical protein